MVIAVMAILGILFIVLGWSQLGVLLLMLSVIIVFFKVTAVIDRRAMDKRQKEDAARKAYEEKIAEEKRKQDLLDQQNRLINQYKGSPLVRDVINTISGGEPYNTPEEIIITDNWISGNRRGEVFTYDFAANRVHSFRPVITVVHHYDELEYVVRPQIAMAETLNFFFDNKFVIYDNAKQQVDRHTDSDGDSYTIITYTSDHVKMVLESTLPNKSF